MPRAWPPWTPSPAPTPEPPGDEPFDPCGKDKVTGTNTKDEIVDWLITVGVLDDNVTKKVKSRFTKNEMLSMVKDYCDDETDPE